MEDEQQLTRVKEWINSRHLDTVELTDVLSNFPYISVVRFHWSVCRLNMQLQTDS